ncbi:MAG: hypothetical protein LBU95_04655 [Rikenellaceae bacterium]|jgi:preprotein translocase subunit SecG|nr:hypothetical protein [Rikenellaceae bacterium]
MEENYSKDYTPQHDAPGQSPEAGQRDAQPGTTHGGRGPAEFTPEARTYLVGAAKWARFISIVGFVAVGLVMLCFLVLIIFATGSGLGAMAGMGELESVFGVIGMQLYFIFLMLLMLVYFIPLYMLYQFATRAQRALKFNDTQTLTSSFEFLRNYWHFIGILVIVMLVLYALIILGAIGAGIVAAMAM